MKSMIDRLKLSLFGIKSSRPKTSIFDEKTSFTTTMPSENITFEEWKDGKWSEFIWKHPNFKF